MAGKLILTSQGLNTASGREVISKALRGEEFTDKRILVIYEPYYSIRDTLKKALKGMGFLDKNICFQDRSLRPAEVEKMDYIYVSEGNTFSILRNMDDLIKPIRKAVLENGATYIGASAGAMIAGVDIQRAKDFDEYRKETDTKWEALGLFDGAIIPHYTPSQLQSYIEKTDKDELEHYKKIYSVANNRAIVLEAGEES